MAADKTKEILEQILAQLYQEQSKKGKEKEGSYLIAPDNQFLGRITDNIYDNKSINNIYGPYGSKYSNTSIFNPYSQYSSQYGRFSINNPYCTTPPKLFINNKFLGNISVNQYVSKRIPTESFLFTLENYISQLLQGQIVEAKPSSQQRTTESFIEAADGTFLGKLKPNQFDKDSIFNQFGPYGNQFSQSSIFNKFSSYGNQFSSFSAYNSFATSPPLIYYNGDFYAYLSTNENKKPRIHPDELLSWAQQNVSQW